MIGSDTSLITSNGQDRSFIILKHSSTSINRQFRKGCRGLGGGSSQAGARKVSGQAAGSRKVSGQAAGSKKVFCQAAGVRNIYGQATGARKASSQPSAAQSTTNQGPMQGF
ncbi:hypothetical protein Tco_1021463 [Tanacetum coccineum]